MKITPLAAESMGSRSMATCVETKECKVLIDPGANVGSLRFGLSPHPLEKWLLQKHRERIASYTQLSDIVIITHYHFDHFTPDAYDLYKNKILFLKNPNQKINVRQRNRAFEFLKNIKGLPSEISYVDGRALDVGKTRFVFSEPILHGAVERMGFVIQVALKEDEETFLFSSDIQGPCRKAPVDFILRINPDFIYLDGPVTYLHDASGSRETLNKTVTRIISILEKTKVTKVIIDHHLLRDLHWREKIQPVFAFANPKGIIIQTASEFRGEENNLLEARRRQLYESDLPERANSA